MCPKNVTEYLHVTQSEATCIWHILQHLKAINKLWNNFLSLSSVMKMEMFTNGGELFYVTELFQNLGMEFPQFRIQACQEPELIKRSEEADNVWHFYDWPQIPVFVTSSTVCFVEWSDERQMARNCYTINKINQNGDGVLIRNTFLVLNFFHKS